MTLLLLGVFPILEVHQVLSHCFLACCSPVAGFAAPPLPCYRLQTGNSERPCLHLAPTLLCQGTSRPWPRWLTSAPRRNWLLRSGSLSCSRTLFMPCSSKSCDCFLLYPEKAVTASCCTDKQSFTRLLRVCMHTPPLVGWSSPLTATLH